MPLFPLSVGGSGTVSSVALSAPSSILTVSGSPVTTTGTLTLALAVQNANKVWAGPTTGADATPTFRSLVAADLPSGTGTVTSVAMTVPSIFSIAGSPITTTGTLAVTLANQSANLVFAGPSTGSASTPAFRSLVAADIPDLSSVYQPLNTKLTNFAALANSAGVLTNNGSGTYTWAAAATGTVTSVALTVPGFLAVAGSPITTNGTLAVSLATQTANMIFSGPTTGSPAAPTFRALVAADIPSLSSVYQPLNANLTAISALTTTSYGLSFLTQANAAAGASYVGLGASDSPTFVGMTLSGTVTNTISGNAFVAQSSSGPSARIVGISSANNGNGGMRFEGYKNRSGGVITSGDLITEWYFYGHDGTQYVEAASIAIGTEGTVATNRIPTNFTVRLHPDSTSASRNVLKIDSSGNSVFAGSLQTASPSSGTAQAFKIGSVASVTPTAQNRTIEIDIAGTTYYLTAKTTNN